MSLLNVEKSRQCGECDACRALHGSECQSPKDGSAEVAALKAQLAAVTEERDEARWENRQLHKNADEYMEARKRAESAESALETCRLVGVSIVRRADCDGWAVTNQRACDAKAALSVAAGANRALREALVLRGCEEGGANDACVCQTCAALAAPPVADPRAEALASALESLVENEAPQMRVGKVGARWRAGVAALDAWRGQR